MFQGVRSRAAGVSPGVGDPRGGPLREDSARGNNAAGNGRVREGAGKGRKRRPLWGPYLV